MGKELWNGWGIWQRDSGSILCIFLALYNNCRKYDFGVLSLIFLLQFSYGISKQRLSLKSRDSTKPKDVLI